MMFGNKNDFAIEAMTEPHLKRPSRHWGRLCIWVEGHKIGDYEDQHCGLYTSYAGFNEKCSILNSLWEKQFDKLSDIEIWNYLDDLLYGYNGNIKLNDNRTLEEASLNTDKYSKYNFLTNWGEMFDRGGKSFILAIPDKKIKILNFDYNENKVNAYECNEFSFRTATKLFSEWYENQISMLDSKNA